LQGCGHIVTASRTACFILAPKAALRAGYFQACKIAEIIDNIVTDTGTYFQPQIPHLVCIYAMVDSSKVNSDYCQLLIRKFHQRKLLIIIIIIISVYFSSWVQVR